MKLFYCRKLLLSTYVRKVNERNDVSNKHFNFHVVEVDVPRYIEPCSFFLFTLSKCFLILMKSWRSSRVFYLSEEQCKLFGRCRDKSGLASFWLSLISAGGFCFSWCRGFYNVYFSGFFIWKIKDIKLLVLLHHDSPSLVQIISII